MAVFKDADNREWVIALDGPNIKAIREQCGVNPVSGEAFEKLYDDPVLLADVLAVICRDQVAKHSSGITPDQFRAGVRGDAIDRARQAFHLAQVDFSPSREREVLKALAAKMEKLREVAVQKDMERINSPELEAKFLAAMEKFQDKALEEALTMLSSASSLPELLASLPKAAPGAN